jgi:hypothetical protein
LGALIFVYRSKSLNILSTLFGIITIPFDDLEMSISLGSDLKLLSLAEHGNTNNTIIR